MQCLHPTIPPSRFCGRRPDHNCYRGAYCHSYFTFRQFVKCFADDLSRWKGTFIDDNVQTTEHINPSWNIKDINPSSSSFARRGCFSYLYVNKDFNFVDLSALYLCIWLCVVEPSTLIPSAYYKRVKRPNKWIICMEIKTSGCGCTMYCFHMNTQ